MVTHYFLTDQMFGKEFYCLALLNINVEKTFKKNNWMKTSVTVTPNVLCLSALGVTLVLASSFEGYPRGWVPPLSVSLSSMRWRVRLKHRDINCVQRIIQLIRWKFTSEFPIFSNEFRKFSREFSGYTADTGIDTADTDGRWLHVKSVVRKKEQKNKYHA